MYKDNESAIIQRIKSFDTGTEMLEIRTIIFEYLRLNKGLYLNNEKINQKWIAKECNIQTTELSMLLNGRKRVTPTRLLKLREFIKTIP